MVTSMKRCSMTTVVHGEEEEEEEEKEEEEGTKKGELEAGEAHQKKRFTFPLKGPQLPLLLLPRSPRLDGNTSSSHKMLPSSLGLPGPRTASPSDPLARWSSAGCPGAGNAGERRCSLVIGAVFQGHISDCPVFIWLNRRGFSLLCPVLLSLSRMTWSAPFSW